ncbi:MAG: hypothetical protein ACE5IL_04780 [Myxococcota bacterium]
MIRLLPRRVVLDPLPHAVAWARAVVGPFQSRVEAYGLDPVEDGETALAVAARRFAREGQPGAVHMVERAGETKLDRLDLPGTRPREARAVLERRCSPPASGSEQGVAASIGARAFAAGDSVVWLATSEVGTEQALEGELEAVGLPVERVVSHVFALGALGRVAVDPAESLSALLWIEAGAAHCVIVDRLGWKFSREIPLKYAGDRMLRRDGSAPSEWQEEEHRQAERLATELQRTLLYVEGQLKLGEVSRLVLCGHAAPLEGVWRVLAANLQLPVTTLSDLLSGWPRPVAPELAAVLGIATLPASAVPNALSLESQRARSRVRTHRMLRRGAALSVAASLALLTLVGARYLAERSDARSVAARWLASQPQLTGLEEAEARDDRGEALARARAQLDSPEPLWSGVLEVMGRLAPPDVYLEELSIAHGDQGWSLRAIVRSQAPSTSRAIASLLRYREALASTGWIRLRSVEPESGPAGITEGAVRYRFQGRLAPVRIGGADA